MSDYRFLVNVEHCIPENTYDYFLYKSRSEDELMVLPPSSLGDAGDFGVVHSSIIRDYLKRFALKIEFFQIIFALQGVYPEDGRWENTLLCKLMDIDRVLIQTGILDSQGKNVYGNFCVFLLRSMKSVIGSQINSTQYLNDRLSADCDILCRMLGVSAEDRINAEGMKNAIDVYTAGAGKEDLNSQALIFFLQRIAAPLDKENECVRIIDEVRKLVLRYEVNELFVDENNKRKKVEAIFRIIDYSTTQFEKRVTTPTGFKQLCKEHWERIKSSSSILDKYAQMMFNYEHRLNEFIRFEQASINSDGNAICIDQYKKLDFDTIRNNGAWLETDNSSNNKIESPNTVIDDFKKNLTPVETLMDKWLTSYEKLCKYTDNLQLQLNKHAEVLREKYLEELDKRNRNMGLLKMKGPYKVDKGTEKEIQKLKEDREQIIAAMKETQITPPLTCKDQTKIESKLTIANNEITHYISCLQATKDVKDAFLLIVVLISTTILCYFLLQRLSFVPPALLYSLCYLFITLLCMAVLSMAPVLFYKAMIKKSLKRLEHDIDDVVKKYELNAKNIQLNINLCNILDDMTQHIHLREYNIWAANNRANAKKWYIERATEHIAKMKDFSVLFKPTYQIQNFNVTNYPLINDDGDITDIVDCMLFWPNS